MMEMPSMPGHFHDALHQSVRCAFAAQGRIGLDMRDFDGMGMAAVAGKRHMAVFHKFELVQGFVIGDGHGGGPGLRVAL